MNKKEVNVTLKWVLSNLNPWMILCLFIFGVTSSFEGVLNGYILGYIPRLNVKDGNSLIVFGLVAVLSYLTVYVSLFLFSLLMQKAIQILNEKIKGIYFRANFASSFNNPNLDSSEVLNNMTSISKQIEEKYFEPLLLLFQSLMTVISSTVVVLMTNPVLGLIYLALSFMSLLPSYMGKEKMKIKTDMWSHSNSNFLAITRDLFAGRFEITNFGVEKLFMQKFDHSLHDEEQRYYQLNAFQYVLQFISWLFAGTVRENLSLLQNFTDQELVAALNKVGLDKELDSKALDFEIKEQGSNLSGGQAQRLAVARGLLRHKKIFLLDKITSSLDHQNADEVHRLIYQLPSIVIEVAHNFNEKIAQENNVKIFNLAQNTK